MHSIKLSIFYLSLTVILISCQQKPGPEQVSTLFWQAVKNNDAEAMQRYSTVKAMPERQDGNNLPNVEQAQLGRIIIDGDEAEIETRLTLSGSQGNYEQELET